MTPIESKDCVTIGHQSKGYLVYPQGEAPTIPVSSGKYQLYTIDMKNGTIRLQQKSIRLQGTFTPTNNSLSGQLLWLRPLN
jgi:hypothetical protein